MLNIFAENKLYLRRLERKINNFDMFFMLWEKLVTDFFKNKILVIMFMWEDVDICVGV